MAPRRVASRSCGRTCGNLFPCHSDPDDGTTFTLDVTGVPAGKLAVFPAAIPDAAPSYQVAWAIDEFQELSLGSTTAGTEVFVWHRANELATAQAGSANLLAVFDWLETTIGPYRFGNKSARLGEVAAGRVRRHGAPPALAHLRIVARQRGDQRA
jgi:hypothetical protein